jgi:Fur family peroxide stress response transcriptional regulator
MERTSKHFRKRDAILSCVRSTNSHPSAEWVYEHVKAEMPDISLATVYRNLSLFKDQGLIMSLGTVQGVERFDGNTHPHVHFVCTNCGGIVDLPGISVPEELNAAVSRDSGGRVDSCQLTFTGLCGECRKLN